MRKDKGQILNLLSVLFALVGTAILCLVLFSYMDLLERKIDINQVSRRYILRMETAGYLTAQDRTALERELSELGVSGITFDGTTLSDAGYGNPVVLAFSGELHYQGIRLITMVQAREEALTVRIEERRVSTAKN